MIQNLVDDQLLRNVRNEIREHISFTPKETDIYKVRFVFPAPSVLCAASLRDPCVALR